MTLADDIARYFNVSAEADVWHADDHIVKTIAAGLERDYVLVKRSDLPGVTERKGKLASAEAVRRDEEAELTKRRDELARELKGSSYETFDRLGPYAQAFIDARIAQDRRIIELERGQA